MRIRLAATVVTFLVTGALAAGDAEARYAEAHVAEHVLGEFARAASLYEDAARVAEGELRLRALLGRARCTEKAGDLESALKFYREVLAGTAGGSALRDACERAVRRVEGALYGPEVLLSEVSALRAAYADCVAARPPEDEVAAAEAVARLSRAGSTGASLFAAVWYYARALERYARTDYAGALSDLKAALARRPDWEAARLALAQTEYVLGGRPSAPEGAPPPAALEAARTLEALWSEVEAATADVARLRRLRRLKDALVWLGDDALVERVERLREKATRLARPLLARLMGERRELWEVLWEEISRRVAALRKSLSAAFAKKRPVVVVRGGGPMAVRVVVLRRAAVEAAQWGDVEAGADSSGCVEALAPAGAAARAGRVLAGVGWKAGSPGLRFAPRLEDVRTRDGWVLETLEVEAERNGEEVKARLVLGWRAGRRRFSEKVEHSWRAVLSTEKLLGGWPVGAGELFVVFER